ncbi:unnamed protein product [Closterium sp. NIES-64]|nr:unnamed protein product [Closterium sp. NIES-64]
MVTTLYNLNLDRLRGCGPVRENDEPRHPIPQRLGWFATYSSDKRVPSRFTVVHPRAIGGPRSDDARQSETSRPLDPLLSNHPRIRRVSFTPTARTHSPPSRAPLALSADAGAEAIRVVLPVISARQSRLASVCGHSTGALVSHPSPFSRPCPSSLLLLRCSLAQARLSGGIRCCLSKWLNEDCRCLTWGCVPRMGVCASHGGMCLTWGYVPHMGVCASHGGMCLTWGYVPPMGVCASHGGMCLTWGYVPRIAAGLHPTAMLYAVPARQQAHVWVVGGVLAGVVYLHCHAMHRPLLALTADVLLVLTTAAALLALLSRALNLPPLLHTARPWQVSEGAAEAVVAAGANVLGAAEGVLRVAASGSDVRLFVKVLLFLYVTAAVGRIASLATIIFFCVISGFTVSLLRSLASSVAGLVNARTTM